MTQIINPRKVALAVISKPLSVLLLENNKYIEGQLILATDEFGKTGIKKGDWDWENADISTATAFTDLPWIVPPSASGVSGTNAFKIRNTDPQYVPTGDNLVITDPRLVGAADPLVSTTQLGVEFRDSSLEIDAVNGILTILNFNDLQDGEHISVVVPAVVKTSGSVDDFLARLIKLETIAAAAIGGALVFWPHALGDIPAGYRENVAMRGKLALGHDPDDADFSAIGIPIGNKMHTNTLEEMVPHTHGITIGSRDLANYADNGPDLTHDPVADNRAFTTDSAGGYLPAGLLVKVATNQVLADRATQSRYFLAIPEGPTPYFPAYVADSLKCKALFMRTGSTAPGLYRYDCGTSSWVIIGDAIPPLTFENGLTKLLDTVRSGGQLKRATITDLNNFNLQWHDFTDGYSSIYQLSRFQILFEPQLGNNMGQFIVNPSNVNSLVSDFGTGLSNQINLSPSGIAIKNDIPNTWMYYTSDAYRANGQLNSLAIPDWGSVIQRQDSLRRKDSLRNDSVILAKFVPYHNPIDTVNLGNKSISAGNNLIYTKMASDGFSVNQDTGGPLRSFSNLSPTALSFHGQFPGVPLDAAVAMSNAGSLEFQATPGSYYDFAESVPVILNGDLDARAGATVSNAPTVPHGVLRLEDVGGSIPSSGFAIRDTALNRNKNLYDIADPIVARNNLAVYSKVQSDALYRPITYVPAFADLTSKPTTLSGYGITDAGTLAQQNTNTTNIAANTTAIAGKNLQNVTDVGHTTTNALVTTNHAIQGDTTKLGYVVGEGSSLMNPLFNLPNTPITAGGVTLDTDIFLYKIARAQGYVYSNYAKGSRATQRLSVGDSSHYDQIGRIPNPPTPNSILLIDCFVNDALKPTYDTASYHSMYKYYIVQAKSQGWNRIASINPSYWNTTALGQADPVTRHTMYNTATTAIATETGTLFYDGWAAMRSGAATYVYSDSLHMTAAGHTFAATGIGAFIASNFGTGGGYANVKNTTVGNQFVSGNQSVGGDNTVTGYSYLNDANVRGLFTFQNGTSLSTFRALNPSSGSSSIMLGGNTNPGDLTIYLNTNKSGGLVGPTYAAIPSPYFNALAFNIIDYSATSTVNLLEYGRGSSVLYGATQHDWYTSPTATSLSGTLAMRLFASGNLGLGSPSTDPGAKLKIGGTNTTGTLGSSISEAANMTPTANNQVLIQNDFSGGFLNGTGALTATITTSATSIGDGTYDNLASTAITGLGSGQTWKVTVSGGVVTAIVPATAATGGIGYANGNTFSVNTITGALFTIASLGYTGDVLTQARFGAGVNSFVATTVVNPPGNGGLWYDVSGDFKVRIAGVTTNLSRPTILGTVTGGAVPASLLTGALAAAQTATTQSAGTNNTTIATTAFTADIVNTATDANYTISSSTQLIKLPVITASRTVTLPTAASYTGRLIRIWNQNTSGTFLWTFASTVKNNDSTTATAIANQTWVVLESDGTNWNWIH
jgi:hypothetical protein